MKKLSLILLALLAFGSMAWAQEQEQWIEVSNESELTDSINHGVQRIRLTGNITLSQHLTIPADKTVTIDLNGDTLFRNLTSATNMGCVIIVAQTGNLNLMNGTLMGGWNSTNDGTHTTGGIVNKGTTTLTNVTIDNCKGNDGGGINNANGATLYITGGTISNCTSNAGGGGIVNKGTAEINGCTLSSNTATTRGGAIWSSSSLSVSGGTMSSNVALAGGQGGDGGAIHIESGTPTFTGVAITNNESKAEGGAIYIKNGTTTLTDMTITGNEAKDAGGIYVKSSATLNLGGTSTLSGNISSEHGGGGIVNYGTVNLSGSVSITGNNCHTNGGGIWSDGTLNMQGTIVVTGNTDQYDATSNVYLRTGHVVTVTGSLGSSHIGIGVQDHTGTVTSGLSGNGDLSCFSNDYPGAANLILDGGEAKFTAPSSIPYIEHVWNDNTNQLVSSTGDCSNYVELTGTDATRELTLADNTYYVVRGSDVRYKRLIAPYTQAYLILCDGAKLTSQITINNDDEGIQSLEIYGQSASSGQLVATGDYTSDGGTHWVQAGIGSSGKWKMGWLTIHGGTITASGVISTSSSPYGSAGIGGGGWGSETTHRSIDGGRVVIYGGTVTAYGGTYGAGIGGGCNYMQAGLTGADCYGGDGGLLIVYGGTVTAYGKNGSAGIGGGCNGYGGNVEIYGGTVKAYGNDGKGAGIGSGERLNGREDHTGGSVIINGGHVEAYGGKYAAGIGGGQGCSGASVRVNGGYVYADGGEDAAGIGSGEEQTILAPNTNGGSLTVYGGHVYADGTGWGAGIGAGEDSDGAEVHIFGGIVEASAGGLVGPARGCAIGSEDGDNHRGTLEIGDAMMVHAGQNPTDANAHLFPSSTRVSACYFRPYAKIEPCNHVGATYTIDGTDNDGTHTLHCTHCLTSETHTHTFDGNNECTVCHIHGSVSTVSVYLPVYENNTYSYGTSPSWTVQLVTGSFFELPAPQATYLPAGVRFMGWRIGSPTELGLSDPRVTENESGLYLAGTNYTVTGDVSLYPRYKTFHVFTKAGNWNEPSNWCWNTVPTPDKEILIAAAANIPDGCTAQTGNSLTLDLEGTITIADGGQLLHTNEVNVTLQKTIAGFGSDNAAQTGWYTIASPVTTNITPAGNMLANTYDLYFYDETSHYWRNHKEHIVDGQNQNTASNFNIESNKGYLYANSANTTLNFAGNTRATDATVTVPLSYTSENASLKGFNLVGNPFTRNLTSGDVIKIGNETFSAYYVADGSVANGKNLIACNIADRAIKPGEGFLVQATEASQNLVFNYTTRGEAVPQPAFVCVEAGNESFMDRAYLQLGQGNTLRKMSISDETPKVYMTHEGDDYAAVTLEAAEGEMPVGFKAATEGTYTLTVSTKGIEANYLHLIDNMTGADVDLLATSSYTFTAKTTDYESRFKLVFSSICGDADGDDESFAFINNGEIIVTDADANATLQVIDVMGRVLVSHKGDVSGNVSTAGMTPGVYVLRLINGDDVKTQKIVINNP